MSSMHTPQTAVQPFAVVRKGFDREQVISALTRLEAEADLLRADRDSAVERAERATADLERERHRSRTLETRVAELGRTPTTSEQMSERLSAMLRLATAEAESIRDNAHTAADRILTEAEETAWQLRESASAELSAIRARNTAIRSEHDAALEAARKRAGDIIRSAERETRRLADEAARKRQLVDDDHRLAADLRRQETLDQEKSRREAAEAAAQSLQSQARSEADALLAQARQRGDTMISDATTYTEQLRDLRRGILSDLAAIRARLEPLPGSVEQEEPIPAPPEISSNGG